MGDSRLRQWHKKLRAWEKPKAATYERISAYPMFVLSMLFLMAFAITVVGSPSAADKQFAAVVIPVTWVAFLVDYLIGLTLSANRLVFVRTHVTQLVAVLMPPLRFLMVVHAFNVLRRLPVKAADKARLYVLYVTTLTMVVSAILVVLFESKSPNSNIRTFGNALWWTGETVSTVGYGDYYPVTLGGRIVATTLFVNGVALLSIITAGLAQRFTSDKPAPAASSPAATSSAAAASTGSDPTDGDGVSSEADETVSVSKRELAHLRRLVREHGLAGTSAASSAAQKGDEDDQQSGEAGQRR